MNKTIPETGDPAGPAATERGIGRRGAGSSADLVSVGVMALQFLASDPVQLQRFLDLSGLHPAELRPAAADPAFFAGLLDFLLGHEPTLLAFSAAAGLEPADVRRAREASSGRYGAVPS